MVRHTTKKTREGISYSESWFFTLSCWVFALFLLWGLVINVREGVPLLSMAHLIFLFFFALLGAIFRDSWTFDVENKQVRSFYGFGPFGKQESFSFDEVSHLNLEHFVRGTPDKDAKPTRRRFRAMIIFSLALQDESMRDIEIIAEKSSAGRTEAALQAIATVTGIPFSIDRPRDMDLEVELYERD